MKTIPLNSLSQAIMLGTGNSNLAPALEGIETNYNDIESRLLASSVIIGLAELGGQTPVQTDVQNLRSGQESQAQLPEKAASLLKRILGGEFEEVLPEFLHRTADKGFIVPPETLPALLGLGKNSLRNLVSAIMGERGRWLAAYNPAWSHAFSAVGNGDWETSTFEARLSLLEQLRGSSPPEALQLVQSTWEQDPPEERAAFLKTMPIGLSMADEPCLETCLDDKRKEVRDVALDCLTCLPESRMVARQIDRLERLLQLKSKVLGGDTLEVTLPEKLDNPTKRDGIGGATLKKGLGEKANWLAQMLSYVSPSHWSQKWNRSPEKLIHAALGSEWKESILLGWTLAATRSADVEWATALVFAAVKQKEVNQILVGSEWVALSRLLSPEKMESLARSTIVPGLSDLHDQHPILELLEAYPHPWSVKMTRTVIGSLKRQDVQPMRWRVGQDLPKFGLRIPPDLAEEYVHGWPKRPGWDSSISRFTALMRFRKEMMEAL